MWGKDFLHLISFLTLHFQVDPPNLSEIASFQTTVYNRFLSINSENPFTIQTLKYYFNMYSFILKGVITQSGQAASKLHTSLSDWNVTHTDKTSSQTSHLVMAHRRQHRWELI